MKKIPLTQGKFALVDDEDFERVNAFKWYLGNLHGKLYALHCRWNSKTNKKETIYLHRVVLQCRKSQSIDHISGDGLDNRRVNLRKCRHGLNVRNRLKSKNNTSGFKGVGWWHNRGRWGKFVSSIRHRGKLIFLGSFQSAMEAAKAYDRAAIRFHGAYAKTNQQLGLL